MMVGGLPRGLPRVWGRSSFALELPPRARALQCLALEIYVSAPGAPPAGAVASGVVQLNLGGLMPEGLQDIGRGTLGLAKWLAMTRLFHGAQLAGLLLVGWPPEWWAASTVGSAGTTSARACSSR